LYILQLRDGPLEFFMDKAFDNEMSKLCAKTEANFDRMMWREGLQSGFFEMQLLRDSYR
jgi:leucyl-tRNA synthetase